MYPLVRELAAADAPLRVPVKMTCRVLGFSTQAYYKWLSSPVSNRDLEDAYLTNAAIDARRDDPESGYRLAADELRQGGHRVGDRRVWRLCSAQGLFSAHAPRKGSGKRAGPPIHDDLVRRDFTANRPNQLWLTDITEHRTAEGKLHLCAIKGVYSNRIVGCSISERMKARIAVDALNNAVTRRGGTPTVARCIVHSDRGSRQHLQKLRQALRRPRGDPVDGRIGSSADNALAESFNATLKREILQDAATWPDEVTCRRQVFKCLVRYNTRRRRSHCRHQSPVTHETTTAATLPSAAQPNPVSRNRR